MILIRRYQILFKTTMTYKTILANNFIVFVPRSHKNSVACCYCAMKTCTINLGIKNVRNLSDKNTANSSKDFESKVMILNESFNKKRVKLNVLKSIIDDLENGDYDISKPLSMMLLSCCGSVLYDEPLTVRLELLDRIWNDLKRKDYPLSLNHYHILLKVYIDNDHAIDPDKFLESMFFKPLRETYCLLLQVPSTNGYAFADAVRSKLEQDILPIDKTICEALAYAYAINGNEDGIAKVSKLVKEENFKISEMKTYLMYLYARNGQIAALTDSLKDATLSLQHINKVVKYLSLSGNGAHIPDILKHMQPLTTEKEIISTIIQLVYAGCIQDACTIITYVPIDEECKDIRRILALCFWKLLIKLNINQSKVMNDLINLEVNVDILQEVIKFSLEENNVKLAIQILHETKATGIVLQPSYFWPILSYVQTETHGPDVYTVIKHMVELDVQPDSTTLLDYVLPYMDLSEPIVTILKMKKVGVELVYMTEPVVKFLLDQGRLEESVKVCVRFRKKIDCQLILDSLYSNYKKSYDINTCANFLYQLTYNGRGFVSSFIMKIISEPNFKTSNGQSLIDFLIASKHHKAVISRIDAENILKLISTMSLNEYVGTSIQNLIHDIIRDTYNENYNVGRSIHPKFMNINQLSTHYDINTKNRRFGNTQRRLFLLACHRNDVKLVSKLLEHMNDNDFIWTFGMKTTLFYFYVENEMTEEAWSKLDEILTEFPNKEIDNFKILRFVTLLITKNRVNDAFNVIYKCTFVNHKPDAHTQIHEILSLLMQNGHLEYVDKMIHLLLERGYYDSKLYTFRYLVLTRILQGNIDEAVILFTNYVNTYKKTPAKQELLTELVKLSTDSSSRYNHLIEKVYKCIVNVHNEDTAIINLAIAYALCNKTLELQNLLKTNNIKRELMLQQFEYLKDSDIITVALAVLEVTETLPNEHLVAICTAALIVYDKQNDYKHAVELQKKMISKDLKPSTCFQEIYTNLLKIHKIPTDSHMMVDKIESNNERQKEL